MAFWHDDPKLKGKFHPNFPDDLQVLVHEGSFRFTDTRPEVMWARLVNKMEAVLESGEVFSFYKGVLLNQPQQLKTLKLHQEIYFLGAENYPHAIRIMPEIITSRPFWEITPCNNCGLPEVFDPIPALWEKTFPDLSNKIANDSFRVFTSFCPVCGNGGSLALKEIKKADGTIPKAPKTDD